MSTAAHWQDALAEPWQATGTDGAAPNLQQVAADRLAAHRQRRAAAQVQAAEQQAELEARQRHHREALRAAHHEARHEAQRRGASVRDAVAARYGNRESYREFLAAEAERAIAQAQAQAEIAARNAQAVAEAQLALLDNLAELDAQPHIPSAREQALAHAHAETRGQLAHALADIVLGARELIAEPPLVPITEAPAPRLAPVAATAQPALREISSAGLTVRLFEDMPAVPPSPASLKPRRGHASAIDLAPLDEPETLHALDEEILFRRDPAFPQPIGLEMQSIPGNLIEFPRELVAPRRARPRLAEGPLLAEPETPQLRIFEVDAALPDTSAYQVATFDPGFLAPPVTLPASGPEWQTLRLGGFNSEHASPAAASDAQTHLALPLHTAPLERRFMAAAVDLCSVAAATLAAFTCVAQIAGPTLRTLPLPLAAASAVATFLVFAVLYQLLFFTLAEATPGMRYARIALCTFGDGNPSRRAMRRRVFSGILAACPLGLGLAWALLDNDKLGWHDRMSRMYQRAY